MSADSPSPVDESNDSKGLDRRRRIREFLDRSRSGAPAAGEAIRDRFSGDEVFERVVATASYEFSCSDRQLFLSGLAAGLSIVLSFLTRATVVATIPGPAGEVLSYLLYPIGFVFIVIGGYQLFTENTLTPVTLVLTRIASVPLLLRVWGIVLVANLLGAIAGGFLLAETPIFTPEAARAATEIGHHALDTPWFGLFFKGLIAGWLVAGMVWVTHAVRESTARVVLVVFIMALIPANGLFHCIIATCEAFYVAFGSSVGFATALLGVTLPITLGNTVGGVILVALLNYGHTQNSSLDESERRDFKLQWFEWLFEQSPRE
ncbi:formate/nitrite transporter family protein [Halococcus salsus]|uniref:formate/nitrite transporter family protein n=1 Tax=Halococcus salsus TaxID=2162894 RepID=UPI001358BDCA|nr:formate/nitrite transporter family protein [Halococcus salsus]